MCAAHHNRGSTEMRDLRDVVSSGKARLQLNDASGTAAQLIRSIDDFSVHRLMDEVFC